MSADRLMAKLRDIGEISPPGHGVHGTRTSVAKLALALLEEMPGDHEDRCAAINRFRTDGKCRCGYDNWQSAIETATRELCGGEDAD